MAASQGEKQPLRLALDTRFERQSAGVFVVGALVSLLAGAWLFSLPYPGLWVFALAGLGFAALWLRRAARIRSQTLHAEQHYLELGSEVLQLREGDRSQLVPWREVASVSIDEDRLRVRIERSNNPPLEIEPRYGLGLQDLAAAVHEALAIARERSACAKATDD